MSSPRVTQPSQLKGVGLFRDHRLQRSRHGLLAHASGDQLAQCFKAAAQARPEPSPQACPEALCYVVRHYSCSFYHSVPLYCGIRTNCHQVARNSGTGGQEFKEEHSPDLTKTDPLPPPPPREAPVPATGWAAPDTPELGPAPPAVALVGVEQVGGRCCFTSDGACASCVIRYHGCVPCCIWRYSEVAWH